MLSTLTEQLDETLLIHKYRGFWMQFTAQFAVELVTTHLLTPPQLMQKLVDEVVDHGYDTIKISEKDDSTFYAKLFNHDNWQVGFDIFKVSVRSDQKLESKVIDKLTDF